MRRCIRFSCSGWRNELRLAWREWVGRATIQHFRRLVRYQQTKTTQAQKVDPWKPATLQIEYVNDQTINALFETVADVVEESILNTLCMAETVTGHE